MSNMDGRLDRVRNLLMDPDFLDGKGLSNEVNIRICCYDPAEEMRVRQFVRQILTDQSLPCRVHEHNLYEILLACCEEKRILNRMGSMEEKKGKTGLLDRIEKAVGVQDYVGKICESRPRQGDVILLTGIGDVFPFMRIHRLLEALSPKASGVPILVMYPGDFNGRSLRLFNRLPPNEYYRAFSII